ncbi:MAG: WYL domain-containing protein [Undibacterium umbellatum]|uniref:WYL domain-containing protein n=1 Tax=Undibacterium umbellatum TaxID=2762300 RepID=UPI003BB5AAD4
MGRTSNLADQRLRDIEILLLWEGQVGNTRLRQLYGIKLGAASVLIKAYRDAFPDRCEWNTVERVFEAIPLTMRAELSTGGIADYDELLQRSHEPDDAITFDGHIDLTCVSAQIFSTLHRACARRLPVEIVYASMTNPDPHSREVFPYKLIQAGRRWHVRALDLKTMTHRDFSLGRITSARNGTASWPEAAPTDVAWNTEVTFQVIPHPQLTQAQAKIIRGEYMGSASARRVSCRAAMVQYVIQQLRIAIDLENEHPPAFQLALASVEPIEKWLFRK